MTSYIEAVEKMTDQELIKRDDALAAIDTFKRDFEQSWKVQFSADIAALPAINLADHIEELKLELDNELQYQVSMEYLYALDEEVISDLKKHIEQLDAKLTECEARLGKAVETIRFYTEYEDLGRKAYNTLEELGEDIG